MHIWLWRQIIRLHFVSARHTQAMEMSAIAARNSALLVLQHLGMRKGRMEPETAPSWGLFGMMFTSHSQALYAMFRISEACLTYVPAFVWKSLVRFTPHDELVLGSKWQKRYVFIIPYRHKILVVTEYVNQHTKTLGAFSATWFNIVFIQRSWACEHASKSTKRLCLGQDFAYAFRQTRLVLIILSSALHMWCWTNLVGALTHVSSWNIVLAEHGHTNMLTTHSNLVGHVHMLVSKSHTFIIIHRFISHAEIVTCRDLWCHTIAISSPDMNCSWPNLNVRSLRWKIRDFFEGRSEWYDFASLLTPSCCSESLILVEDCVWSLQL